MKTIILSSLAARYYKRLGWSLDILNKYLKRGSFMTQDFVSHSDEYYILDVGSSLDIDKLLENFPHVIIKPYCSSEAKLSKKELLQSRGWE